MRPPTHAFAIAALVALTVAACGGSDTPTGAADDDTAVAGVVIERSEDASSSDALPRLPAGPAAAGITWTRVDGDWVGLGARTLTAGGSPDPFVLDVTADSAASPRPDGCEVLLQAPSDAGLLVDGHLELRVVVDEPDGASSAISLEPIRLDVELQPGELHRSGTSGGKRLASTLDRPADTVSVVRCEGRFEPR